MKRILYCILIGTALAALPHLADGQWVQTSGPTGGEVLALAVFPDSNAPEIVLAGSVEYGGIFCSTSGGAQWLPVNTGLQNPHRLYTFGQSGSVLLAGSSTGMFRSTDRGGSWVRVTTGLPSGSLSFYAIATMESTLFAGTSPSSVYRSTDQGNSWVLCFNGFPASSRVVSLAVVDTLLLAGTNLGGVYRSTDRGSTWVPSSAGLTEEYVAILLFKDPYLFAATGGGGIFRSSDHGSSWQTVNNGLEISHVSALVYNGENLFAGTFYTGPKICRSTDHGLSWTPAFTGIDHAVYSLASSDSGILAATYDGVFRSSNDGASWAVTNTGLANAFTHALAFGESGLFAAATSGVWKSTDNGVSWATTNGIPANEFVRSVAVINSRVFAGMFVSSDHGTSWTTFAFPFVEPPRSFVGMGTNILAASPSGPPGSYVGGVALSVDSGTSWTAVVNGLVNRNVRALAASGQSVFAATEGGIFRSSNLGTYWETVNTGLTVLSLFYLAASGPNIFASDVSGRIFLSTNNGDNWIILNRLLPLGQSVNVRALYTNGGRLYVGTDSALFFSDNNGTSWSRSIEGLTNTFIYSVTAGDSFLFAGTRGSGVWRVVDVAMGTTSARQIAISFELFQNYPNPFNPSTTIEFRIPRSSFVTLTIFDLLGREVATLVNEEMEPGSYERVFTAEGLASGVYFCRLQAGRYPLTRKLLLIR